MSTYLAMYVASLEKIIEDGGKQEDVDKAFAEYNTFNQEAFETWLATVQAVPCISCGEVFKPEKKPATNEILCQEHQPK